MHYVSVVSAMTLQTMPNDDYTFFIVIIPSSSNRATNLTVRLHFVFWLNDVYNFKHTKKEVIYLPYQLQLVSLMYSMH